MTDPKTAAVRDLLNHLAQYLATPPTLTDEEYHHLTLTSDGKLRVDDPITHSKIDDVEAKLDHTTYGLAALETLVDEVETYLKHATYGLSALQILLAAIPTTPELEADALARYTALAGHVDEVESLLENATYGLSALNDDLDTLLARLTLARATKLDNLDALALGQPLVATAGVMGSGWIVGAYLSASPVDVVGIRDGRAYMTLSVDGGTAITVLDVRVKSQAIPGESSGGAGMGMAMLIRYTTGFTPSVASSNVDETAWGVIYVSD